MPKCRAIRAAYNSRAATVQLGSSCRAATPLPTHSTRATDVSGGLMCQATGALTAIAEKRRRVWRFPLIYCVATWEFFLFQPLIAMLMFGAIFCLALKLARKSWTMKCAGSSQNSTMP